MPMSNSKIQQKGLSAIEDQLNYEALAVKKYRHAAQMCTNPELVDMCNNASSQHRMQFDRLFNYLSSHC